MNENEPIIKVLSDWLDTCPRIAAGVLRAEYLGKTDNDFTIDTVPTEPVIKRYIDGSTLNQFAFVIGSRQAYGEDTLQNIANSGLFEDIATWIRQQNATGTLPQLDDGMTATKVEALTTTYLIEDNPDIFSARYQIQCRLTYFKEAD